MIQAVSLGLLLPTEAAGVGRDTERADRLTFRSFLSESRTRHSGDSNLIHPPDPPPSASVDPPDPAPPVPYWSTKLAVIHQRTHLGQRKPCPAWIGSW
jgi:hypothetical protein